MSTSTNAGAWFGTLGIHCAIFAGTSLIFGHFRRHKLLRKFYAAKRYANTNRRKPNKLPQGFFAWMTPLMGYSDTDIAEIAGVDALTFLRLQHFGMELFAFITILGALVIIPTNYAGGAIKDSEILPPGPPLPMAPPPPPNAPLPDVPDGITCSYDVPIPEVNPTGNLDKITMSNIPKGSNLLWVHLCVCVAIVFYALWLLWRYNAKCVVARLAYLGAVEPGAEANTVIVQDIPGLRSGSFLDAALKAVQGPLRLVTPKSVNQKIENKIAENFGAGSGVKIPRTREARLRWEADGGASGSGAVSVLVGNTMSGIDVDSSKTPLKNADEDQDYLTPRGSLEKAQEDIPAVALPQVVVELDGREMTPEDQEEEGAELADADEDEDVPGDNDSAPPDAGDYEHIPDLKTLQKDLMAWPAARQYLADHSVEELVLKYFQAIYGDDVACVNIIPSQQALYPLINSYDSTAQALEDLLNEYSYAIKRKLKLKVKVLKVIPRLYGNWATSRFGTKSVKVEAIAFYMARLEDMNNKIRDSQAEADVTAEPTAFVTFRSRVAQTIASTALQDHDTGAWTVAPAPGPDEIIWSNLGMRAWFRGVRSLLMAGAYVCIILFYGIPVTILQGWLTGFLLPITPEIFQSLLPGIVLKILLAMLPTVLGFLAVVGGAKSQREVQWQMVARFFPFQVIVVFIFQMFGQLGSNLIELSQVILANPSQLFNIIAAYAPLQSWFFASYVLVLGLSSRAIQILNAPQLAMYYIKSLTAVTASAKERVLNQIFFQYGAYVPIDTMTLLLGLVFAVQNPLMPFVALIAFFTGNFVFRYNLMYVYSEQFQSGGAAWPMIVNQILTGVIAFELVMVGMFSLFDSPFCSIIMIVMMILTAGYWWIIIGAFSRPQRVMSMTAAASMDEKSGTLQLSTDTLQRIYQPPVMRDNDELHDTLMEQALQVLDKISIDPAYQNLSAMKEIPEPRVPTSSVSSQSTGTPVRSNTQPHSLPSAPRSESNSVTSGVISDKPATESASPANPNSLPTSSSAPTADGS